MPRKIRTIVRTDKEIDDVLYKAFIGIEDGSVYPGRAMNKAYRPLPIGSLGTRKMCLLMNNSLSHGSAEKGNRSPDGRPVLSLAVKFGEFDYQKVGMK